MVAVPVLQQDSAYSRLDGWPMATGEDEFDGQHAKENPPVRQNLRNRSSPNGGDFYAELRVSRG